MPPPSSTTGCTSIMATGYKQTGSGIRTISTPTRSIPAGYPTLVELAFALLHTPQARAITALALHPPALRETDDITGTAHDREGHVPARPVSDPVLFRRLPRPRQRRVRGADDEQGPRAVGVRLRLRGRDFL